MTFRQWRERIRDYNEITNTGPIVRRYFVIGAFDGALTILGLVLGAAAAGAHTTQDPARLVLFAGAAASVGLAVSSGVGAFEAERVERKLDQHSLERAMLTEMGRDHRGAFTYAAWVSSLVHALAPVVAGVVPLLPFAVLPFTVALVWAIVLTLAFLFIMGAFLGSLVKERFLQTGLRFVVAGLATALVLYLFGAI
jgi:predicted membrane protein (TIGR00267 family)